MGFFYSKCLVSTLPYYSTNRTGIFSFECLCDKYQLEVFGRQVDFCIWLEPRCFFNGNRVYYWDQFDTLDIYLIQLPLNRELHDILSFLLATDTFSHFTVYSTIVINWDKATTYGLCL